MWFSEEERENLEIAERGDSEEEILRVPREAGAGHLSRQQSKAGVIEDHKTIADLPVCKTTVAMLSANCGIHFELS
jgi:hypothetical protein